MSCEFILYKNYYCEEIQDHRCSCAHVVKHRPVISLLHSDFPYVFYLTLITATCLPHESAHSHVQKAGGLGCGRLKFPLCRHELLQSETETGQKTEGRCREVCVCCMGGSLSSAGGKEFFPFVCVLQEEVVEFAFASSRTTVEVEFSAVTACII